MATYASRPAWEVRARAVTRARVAVPAGLVLLVLLSALLRVNELGIGLWIDEGLSVGIADRPLSEIPQVLRQDGSPPLYYALLHLWIGVAGTSDVALRSLSLLFALLAVPVAWWAGRALLGTRTAWIAAVLTATNPYLTQYAQEARMYALVAVLSLVACACLGRALAPEAAERDRRPWAVGAALALAGLLYTHNWALYFGAAWGGAWLVLLWRSPGTSRPGLLRSGAIAFGGALLLWLPWIPTFVGQVVHTGAPWARTPAVSAVLLAPGRLMGTMALAVLVLAGGAGLAALVARGHHARLRTTLMLLGVGVATVVVAWLVSQVSPTWANRYLAMAVAPFVLAAAGALASAGRLGLAALVLVAAMGVGDGAPKEKSNVKDVTAAIAPSLRAGDLVVSTQPEQVPVLHHYLPDGVRFATLTGPVRDVGVTDWRDGTRRLRVAEPRRDLQPQLDALRAGARLALVMPVFANLDQWQAPWTHTVRVRSNEWLQYVSNDPRFRVVAIDPPPPPPAELGPIPVQARVYVKTRP